MLRQDTVDGSFLRWQLRLRIATEPVPSRGLSRTVLAYNAGEQVKNIEAR